MERVKVPTIIGVLFVILLAVFSSSCKKMFSGNADTKMISSGTVSETDTDPAEDLLSMFPPADAVITANPKECLIWKDYLLGTGQVVYARRHAPLKLNLRNLEVSDICPDPFCYHSVSQEKGSCIFHGFFGMCGVWNDTLYYLSIWKDINNTENRSVHKSISKYNLITEEYTETVLNLEQPIPDGASEITGVTAAPGWMYEQYLFTDAYLPITDEAVHLSDYHRWLVCLNVDTNEMIRLTDLTEIGTDTIFSFIFGARSGKVYYVTQAEQLYEVDVMNGQNRIILDADAEEQPCFWNFYAGIEEDWFWYAVTDNETSATIKEIRKISLSDGRKETVLYFPCRAFSVCHGSIYCVKQEFFTDGSNWRHFTLYRFNMDGTGETELFGFDSQSLFYFFPVEDKLYFSTVWSGGCILYDPATGEQTLIPTPEE